MPPRTSATSPSTPSWGNRANFYRPSGYAQGLTVLGQLENGIDHLATATGEVPETVAIAS